MREFFWMFRDGWPARLRVRGHVMGFGTVGVQRRMRLSGLLDMPWSLPQGYSAIAIPEIGEGVREGVLGAIPLPWIQRERGIRRVARESGCPACLRVRGHIMGFGDVILAFLMD